jgi:hypothetical protein
VSPRDPRGATRALQLALAAFLMLLVGPLAAPLQLLGLLLALGAFAMLYAASREDPPARRHAVLAVGLLLLAFVAGIAYGALAARALGRGDFRGWVDLGWLYAAASVALAAAFYVAPQTLVTPRSRTLLGAALGIAIAVAVGTVVSSQGAGERFVAGGEAIQDEPGSAAHNARVEDLQRQFAAETEQLVAVQGLPYVVFAWAYATTLGALARARGAEERNP